MSLKLYKNGGSSMTSWERERRLDYIDDKLSRHEEISRKDLIQYFGISVPQASKDIQMYLSNGPDVTYNKSSKRYVIGPHFRPIRGSSERRWNAWSDILYKRG